MGTLFKILMNKDKRVTEFKSIRRMLINHMILGNPILNTEFFVKARKLKGSFRMRTYQPGNKPLTEKKTVQKIFLDLFTQLCKNHEDVIDSYDINVNGRYTCVIGYYEVDERLYHHVIPLYATLDVNTLKFLFENEDEIIDEDKVIVTDDGDVITIEDGDWTWESNLDMFAEQCAKSYAKKLKAVNEGKLPLEELILFNVKLRVKED